MCVTSSPEALRAAAECVELWDRSLHAELGAVTESSFVTLPTHHTQTSVQEDL